MTEKREGVRPGYVTDEHLKYLDDLRESGVTNMSSGGRYLIQKFGLSVDKASSILSYWMKSFGDPNR